MTARMKNTSTTSRSLSSTSASDRGEELMELAKGKQEQAMQILQERGIKSIKDITVNDYESVKAEFEKLSKGEG